MTKSKSTFTFSLLLLATAALAPSAQADKANTTYLLYGVQRYYCDYYDGTFWEPEKYLKESLDTSLDSGHTYFTSWVFNPDTNASVTCSLPEGYFVNSWQLDAAWGVYDPSYPQNPPKTYYTYGAGNPVTVTFEYSKLGDGTPKELELVPHLKMMHYTLAYDKNATDATGTVPAAADHYWAESVTATNAIYSRTGYTPAGWNTKADGSGVAIAFGATMTGKTFPVTTHNQAVALYAQWQANPYTLQLQPGAGIERIYYAVAGRDQKIASTGEATSPSLQWSETTVATNVSVSFDTTWFAYAVAKEGYSTNATCSASGKMTTSGATFAPAATANKYRLCLNPGVGISEIYYKVNGAANWSRVSGDIETNVDNVDFDTDWFAYAVAKVGYSTNETCVASGTMTTAGATFNPAASVNSYNLKLTPGTGIAKIFYQFGEATSPSLQWSETTVATNVAVKYGTTWRAYAEARPGYTYVATSAKDPMHGTIGTSGDSFTATAAAKTYTVSFSGNGETSGGTSDKTFTYDQGAFLPKNGFVRGYLVTFAVNGGTSCDSQTASYPLKTLCWNDKADGSGAYSYSNQQMVTNPCNSTGEAVMLYAQWDTNSVQAVTLPWTEKSGHTFSGWYLGTERVGGIGDKYTPTNSVALSAGWDVVIHTVKFYDGDPTEEGTCISTQYVADAQSATPPDMSEHTKQYYKFSSWNTTEWKKVLSDLDVWAKWTEKKYWLKLWKNYTSSCTEYDSSDNYCGKGLEYTKLTLEDACDYYAFSKPGYGFAHWAANPEGTGDTWNAGTELGYRKLDVLGGGMEAVSFYAIWAPNSYTVIFDKGVEAATGTMTDQEFVYDTPQSLTGNLFQYEGQTFLHWHDAANNADYADGAVVSNLTTVANGTVTLTAVWSNNHYVRFDRNGATNETEMALQKFSGAETNVLSANVYGRIGYTFTGWATNAVSATNLVVTYTNCQEASFPDAKANETNILYAVWATNRYTIVFDPGNAPADTNRFFFGTMAPLTNCAYDTDITIKCGYTNYCSQGLLGWSRTKGATTPDYKIYTSSPLTQGGDTIVSNLTAEADATQILYAVWADEGDLSKAVGLTNAVLVSKKISGDDVVWCAITNMVDRSQYVALERNNATDKSKAASGDWILKMLVVGSGRLGYVCNWEQYGDPGTTFKLKVDGAEVQSIPGDTEWMTTNVVISGEGIREIVWEVDGTINDGTDKDIICIDDVTWTPGVVVDPSKPPTYETEAEAKAAAAGARVARPNAAVEGVVSAEDYSAMFDVKAVQTAFVPPAAREEWTLVPELKPDVSNEVQTVLNEAETNLCSVITNNPISVSFVMKPGLYYGLAGANAVEDLPEAVVPAGKWVLGTGAKDGQSVSADRPPEAAARFYELRMVLKPE